MIRLITVENVKDYISKMKSSDNVRYDNVTARILKQASPILSILIMHVINTMIRRKWHPKSLICYPPTILSAMLS